MDKYYLKEVLKAILHSILFHRSFALTSPLEVTLQGFQLTTVKLDDKELDRFVDEKVSLFISTLDSHQQGQVSPTNEFRWQLVILFFVEKKAKAKYWFSKTDEDMIWEVSHPYQMNKKQWEITVDSTRAVTEKEHIEARKKGREQVQNVLLQISRLANEYKDHIPAITTQNEMHPFPYQIIMNTQDPVSWTSMLKGLLA